MRRGPQAVAVFLPAVIGSVLLYSCGDANGPEPPPAATGPGQWAAPFPWPTVAVHLHLLPDGRLLSFARNGQPHIWDPALGTFAERPSASNLFCSGHTFLADGRLLVTGGHIDDDRGLPDANIFDPASEAWTRIGNMARGRWYPTSTILANGDVITVSGEDEDSLIVEIPEILPAGGTQFRPLPGASRNVPYYPRMFLAPNGMVFYAGQNVATSYLDPAGEGRWIEVGERVVNRRGYGSAVMYEPGKVLYAGGGNDPATNTAEVIDLNESVPKWRLTGSMAFARQHHNATLLPDGTVLATGGTSVGGKTTQGAVFAAELWDPRTERWRTLASNQVIRVYHSTTILLPDARVLNAGSGDGSGLPRELNAEIFSPPYLFDSTGAPAARPTITDVPTTIGYGQSFVVQTPEPAAIRQVTLLRLGSVTHAFDQNQRFNRLTFTRAAGGLNVTAPAHGNLAPPGHYMVFILNGDGVPSVARIVRLG